MDFVLFSQNVYRFFSASCKASAQKVIQEAMTLFRKSKEEARITIANAVVTAKRDVDQAIAILRSVPPNSQYAVLLDFFDAAFITILVLINCQCRRMVI